MPAHHFPTEPFRNELEKRLRNLLIFLYPLVKRKLPKAVKAGSLANRVSLRFSFSAASTLRAFYSNRRIWVKKTRQEAYKKTMAEAQAIDAQKINPVIYLFDRSRDWRMKRAKYNSIYFPDSSTRLK